MAVNHNVQARNKKYCFQANTKCINCTERWGESTFLKTQYFGSHIYSFCAVYIKHADCFSELVSCNNICPLIFKYFILPIYEQ